jgi:hypothetical protein
MKKTILLIVMMLVMILLTAGSKVEVGQKRLTVINKSGDEIRLRLARLDDAKGDEKYYLTVAEGTRAFPTEEKFTVDAGWYSIWIDFYEVVQDDETEDITYELRCSLDYTRVKLAEQRIDLNRNQKINVLPCDSSPPKKLGEQGAMKYWFPAYVIDVDRIPEPVIYLPYIVR